VIIPPRGIPIPSVPRTELHRMEEREEADEPLAFCRFVAFDSDFRRCPGLEFLQLTVT
jgi:hypothetical protein